MKPEAETLKVIAPNVPTSADWKSKVFGAYRGAYRGYFLCLFGVTRYESKVV